MRRHERDLQESSEAFHSRATPRRLPALSQDAEDGSWLPGEDITEDDFWFIAGPDRANASSGRWKPPVSLRLMSRLAVVPLVALLLLGVQGFVFHSARDCAASQRGPACFALSLFPSQSGSQVMVPPTPTPRPAPAIPAIPNDVPANVHGFLVLAMPYAVQAHQALGWPTSVIMAQWGLEHGWFVPDYTGYNWGNVSAIAGEPSVGGINVPGSPAAFAYARTPADGLRYFLSAARLPYYAGVAPAARQGGADAAAVALGHSPWDAGHYTNIGQPGSSLLAIMRDFNFYRFDVGG